MKNLNTLAVALAAATFAVGWYVGSSDETLTITSSKGGKSYSGGYVAEQTTSAKSEGAVKLRTTEGCLLYTSPSPRDRSLSRMPSSA